MSTGTVHPELKKTPPKLTMSAWNIRIFRFLLTYLAPKRESSLYVETSTKDLDGIQLRIHKPKSVEPTSALLWIHGGGLIVGTPAQDDWRCAQIAERLGVLVVAIQYRLAPEHVYPAAIDDCFATWMVVQKYAKDLGLNPHKIAIGGASAGGGLAANLALRIRDAGGVQPVGQLLVYPMLDDRTALRSDVHPKGHFVWNNKSNMTGWRSYLGIHFNVEKVPKYAVASRHDNLQDLPPVWIGVGTLDLFYDEDLEYANRVKDSDVPTVLETVEGAYHGFDEIDRASTVSESFMNNMIEFLRPLL